MNCKEVKEFSSDYLDGRLAPAEVIRLEEHMYSCSACARELAQLRATLSLMSSLSGIDTSPDFVVQVNRKIDGGRTPSRLWIWFVEPMRIKLPLEAAALLLVSTLAFYLYQRSPELSEKSLVFPETTVETTKEQPRERGPEPGSEAPAAKPLLAPKARAKKETPPVSQAARARGAIRRAVPSPAAPAAVAEQEMRSQEREVVVALKQEPRATEPSAAREREAKQGMRFSLEVGKAPAEAPMAATQAEVERQRSQAKGAGVSGAAGFNLARSAPSSQVLEVFTEDVALSQRQLKSLVEELGGKIVSERASDDGLLLAVELPQSRQVDFQSALKKEPAREISAFWEPPAPRPESASPAKGSLDAARPALSEAKKSTREKDEPTVKLEVRIRRKR